MWAQTPPDAVAQARELFVGASELRDQGDVRGALEKFKAAHALAVNPITTFELGRTYEALGMLEQARDAYESIARLPVQPNETERATAARRDAAKAAEGLKSRAPAPAVTTTVPPSPAPPAAPTPATPACKEEEPRPQLALASFVDDASRQAPDTSGNHFGPAAYVGFGVGAAGFVAGTILAAATMSKASAMSCNSASCEQSSEDAAHAAKNLGIAATVSYTIAAGGVAVGVMDLLLYKRGPSAPTTGLSVHPWIGAGAGGLRGSF